MKQQWFLLQEKQSYSQLFYISFEISCSVCTLLTVSDTNRGVLHTQGPEAQAGDCSHLTDTSFQLPPA